MEAMTLRQLLQAVGGTLLGDVSDLNMEFADVCTDSRQMKEGSLFIPLENGLMVTPSSTAPCRREQRAA